MSDKVYWVALSLINELGPKTTRKLLREIGDPEAIFSQPEALERLAWLMEGQVKALQKMSARLASPDGREQLEGLMLELDDNGVTIISEQEDQYPSNLRGLPDSPPLLYIRGSLETQDELALAIVGTRSPTKEGEEMAFALAQALAEKGVTIVSGLAEGIDSAAHLGALEADGRTIAVLGSGIMKIYPRNNQDLAEGIAGQGAVISEFSPLVSVSTRKLMQRNRVQAGLSKGVLVIESREKGGSLITAKKAREYGRHILAIDWDSKKDEAVGTKCLLDQGAFAVKSIEDADEIVELLQREPKQQQPPLPLEERNLINE